MACDFVVATERALWGMPEVDVGITPGWGGTTRMARLIGRRMTKEVNLLGALHPAARAVQLGLWNRVVPDDQLEAEVDALVEVLLSKNQQAVRQLKFIINRGVEADLYTAQGFEALSAGLTGAVNGGWDVPDADARRRSRGVHREGQPVAAAPWAGPGLLDRSLSRSAGVAGWCRRQQLLQPVEAVCPTLIVKRQPSLGGKHALS